MYGQVNDLKHWIFIIIILDILFPAPIYRLTSYAIFGRPNTLAAREHG